MQNISRKRTRPAQDLASPSPRTGTYRRLIQRLAAERWFASVGRRLAPLDRQLYRLSRGRLTVLGPQGAAMPDTCLLTTVGRRSGKRRTTPVMFLRSGDELIISSESFGQQRPAAWPLNLDQTPSAEVQIGSEVFECSARALDDEEADRHWPAFVGAWPAHEHYLRRSGVRRMFSLHSLAPAHGDRRSRAG